MLVAEAVLATLAERHAPPDRVAVVDGLREIWHSVAGDLTPEEAAAVLWSVAPLAVVVGSPGHAAARARLARALYPDASPAAAVSRLRAVCRRPAVVSTVAALRAEESAHVLGERARVRGELWSILQSAPPEGSEPRDINAHTALRLKALASLVDLDSLAAPPPPAPVDATASTVMERVKKKLDRLAGSCQT